MPRFATTLILMLLAAGCGQNPPQTGQSPAVALTADDLAHANDIRWWYINVPDVPKGKALCMALVDDQGIIESRACPPAAPGDQIKLVLSGFADWNLHYSLVTDTEAYRSTIENHLLGYDGPTAESSSGRPVNVGEFMVKRSNSNQVDGTDHEIHPMEIALTFTIEDDAQPWCREGYRPPGKMWLIRAQREAIPVDAAFHYWQPDAADHL